MRQSNLSFIGNGDLPDPASPRPGFVSPRTPPRVPGGARTLFLFAPRGHTSSGGGHEEMRVRLETWLAVNRTPTQRRERRHTRWCARRVGPEKHGTSLSSR